MSVSTTSMENMVLTQCHQYATIPMTRLSINCSVCNQTFMSKRALHVHFGKMHHNDTAFDDSTSRGMKKAGNIELVDCKMLAASVARVWYAV